MRQSLGPGYEAQCGSTVGNVVGQTWTLCGSSLDTVWVQLGHGMGPNLDMVWVLTWTLLGPGWISTWALHVFLSDFVVLSFPTIDPDGPPAGDILCKQ